MSTTGLTVRYLGAAAALLLFVVSTAACGSSKATTTRDAATDARPHDAGPSDARDASHLRDGGHDAHDAAHDGAVDGPFLVALSVAGAGSGLQPTFSPGVYDYFVHCNAADGGLNALMVSMTASPGALSSIQQPAPVSPSKPEQTVAVSVPDGALMEAVATSESGNASTDYFIRCLPSDFPELEMTAYPDAGTPSPGYYLVGTAVDFPPAADYVMLLDSRGVPVWYHPVGPNRAVSAVDHVVDGAISFNPISTFPSYGSPFYPFEVEQLSPLETTTIADAGYGPGHYPSDEHELRYLGNGHYLTFATTLAGPVDLTGLTIPAPSGDGGVALGPNSMIEDCTVVEVDATGEIYWQWNASDHFDPAKVCEYPQYPLNRYSAEAGTVVDVFHCDSIDVDPANGNLLVSARHMDSIFYIDRATGSVLWKMGGPNFSKDNATYVSVADKFLEQHDGRLHNWLATCQGGTGQVSLIDDETTGTIPARGTIYDVVVGGGDGGCTGVETFDGGAPAPGTARLAWQYSNANGSSGGGDVQIFSDGSHLVGWGLSNPTFTEINASGQKMLEFSFPRNLSYRALKLPLSAFDISVLRSTAGK